MVKAEEGEVILARGEQTAVNQLKKKEAGKRGEQSCQAEEKRNVHVWGWGGGGEEKSAKKKRRGEAPTMSLKKKESKLKGMNLIPLTTRKGRSVLRKPWR